MNQQQAFEYNKRIAVDNNLLAHAWRDDGMVYFLDTSFSDIREQIHFAHHLDFVNSPQLSAEILSMLLTGDYYTDPDKAVRH